MKENELLLNADSYIDKITDVVLHEASVIPARMKYSTLFDMMPSYRFEIMMDPDELPKTGLTESEIVYTDNKVMLKRYITDDKITQKTPILFIYALINKPYILDLRPGNSVVEYFKSMGFDVYIIDWGIPSDEDRFLTFEDYIDGYINNCIDVIRDRTGSDKVNLFGWCMGGNFSVIYTSLYQEKIKNLLTLTIPMDAGHGGLLSLWAKEELFHISKVIKVYGNMPAKLIRYSIISIYPFREMRKNANFYDHLQNREFLNAYALVEKWMNDNIDVPGLVFEQYIKDIFQSNNLLAGKMRVGNRYVDLKDITCPVLNIAAKEDNLIPNVSSSSLNENISSKDNEFLIVPGGHVGFTIDTKVKQYWPKIAKWYSDRD